MTQAQALEVLKSGENVFLTGEPGSGKTYTINMFAEWLNKTKFIFPSVTASTGIAATHINGTTIHSWAGIGIANGILHEGAIDTIISKPYVSRRLAVAKVLIIDEISMIDATVLNNVDLVLRAARGNKPFGGLQVVFVGDFFQLPPVTKQPGFATFAFESEAWKAAAPAICYLTEQHRQEDQEFLEILTALRSGTITHAHIDRLKKCARPVEDEMHITRLFTHNQDVDRINNLKLAKIDAPSTLYEMQGEGVPYILEQLKKSCLSPEKLVLKPGALVMFTRNNFEEGYVNGTIGEVVECDSYNPVVRLPNGEEVIVGRAEWSVKQDGHIVASIVQIPLRLAWAMTVHKSQGMSLDRATVDLSGAFEYGQGYVALSRVRSLAGLYIEGLNAHALKMHPKVVEQDKVFRQMK